ncbi:MAG: hypothetical protein JW720_03335 [Sedimentisphaerales bacterium]|nr:hypothetical protein [Sedimentisphaerales bacterium]
MLRKFAVFGCVLLVIGGAVLGWVLSEKAAEQKRLTACRLKYSSEPDEYLERYSAWLKMSPDDRASKPLEVNGYGQAKTKAEIELDQKERLEANLDGLATGELDIQPFADVLYGENWRDIVEQYRKRKEFRESVLTGSVVMALTGGITFSCCFVFWLLRLLVGGISRLKRPSLRPDAEQSGNSADGYNTSATPVNNDDASFVPFVHAARAIVGQSAKDVSLDVDSVYGSSQVDAAGRDRRKIPLLVPSENSAGAQKTSTSGGSKEGSSDRLGQRRGGVAMLEESLKAKARQLEEQMRQFKRRNQNVEQNASDISSSTDGTLKELAEQVSAIREYAAHQQERVQKLQDGYDWNIIRTFCLRVIRCIDNMESRIESLLQDDAQAEHLDEAKDELIFALESSGVEQFRPELNSLYSGQEKSTEVIKEKEKSDDPEQTGRIAKVVRPGYQYFIDEGNTKIVRAAQVKLYG